MAQLPELAPDLTRTDDLPVGVQLAWRIRVLIASGELAPGDRLPGVRELAGGTGVNVNTARAVYGRLEAEGLIVSEHGRGTFVAAGVSPAPELERLAAEAADGALAEGVDPRDLARAIYAGAAGVSFSGAALERGAPEDAWIDELPEIDTEGDERGARHELRRQIGRLEAALASYPEEARTGAEQRHPLLRPKGHVAGIGELEEIRDRLVARLKAARAEAERRGARERRARTRLEEMASDPSAHKWESVSNEEMGEPGCATWDVQPRWGPVGALMNWWRVKVSSGCPLAGWEATFGETTCGGCAA